MTFLMYFVGSENVYHSLNVFNGYIALLGHKLPQQIFEKRSNDSYNGTIETIKDDSRTGIKFIVQNKQEIHHVFFLKVHKAASSTGMNIMMRFALSRNLSIMIPRRIRNSFSQQSTLRADLILDYSPGTVYDIACNHVVFEKKKIIQFMPPDTVFIGTVRHPFSQFRSAFLYYRNTYYLKYLQDIPGPNPMLTYLKNPLRYETNISKYLSFTNNRMSLDYGATVQDTEAMKRYVDRLDQDFHLILLVERFNESLVLLKRLLGWKTKDILHIPQKRYRGPTVIKSQLLESLHKKWARLDYILYGHFKQKFESLLAAQDEMFYKELDYFKNILSRTTAFCAQFEVQSLLVPKSRWNTEFTVTSSDCVLIKMKSKTMNKMVRNLYLNKKTPPPKYYKAQVKLIDIRHGIQNTQ
ncbi:galactose-3-O-sulfotransferase 2-like [Gigantopelta aegis]|uniref:galactose-3-O-sulfotransferase 2-like n=1 Tax=Gigantopelta aegis TaxID=1735272 RepID=UPI001B88A381|nr:galactose-3-O-sulfotransferase 2-like [Gigantopelta aegis]